jgi:hypothetical protein
MLKEDIKYDTAHGSAFDRGSADSYYSRPRDPHLYPNGTYNEPRIPMDMMSPEEIEAYHAGYDHNERFGDKKSWD